MRKALENCVKLLLLTARIIEILGKVVVLRGYEEYSYASYNTRRLLCMSNEDGNALVWNTNLIWKYSKYAYLDRGTNMSPTHYFNCEDSSANNNPLNCKLNTVDACMSGWSIRNWKLVSSRDVPMGPVFDSRWEEFTEYDNFHTNNKFYSTHKLRKTGTLVFSVRGKVDAHMALCNTDFSISSFCYWIIIGGWGNTRSIIRKCAFGLPEGYPDKSSECSQEKVGYNHTALSETEWRTFILSWNEQDHSVQLYDMEKRILAYVDTGDISLNGNDHYYLFIRSTHTILFRFHIYNYLQTSDVNDVLLSPSIYVKGPDICLQTVIGLCTQCAMDIYLIDTDRPTLMKKLLTLNGPTVAQDHGLPMWQSVKINATIPENFGVYVQLKFVPILKNNVEDAVWAIANAHECPAEDTVTVAVMGATQDYDYSTGKYNWPIVTCQKFSYNGYHIVSAVADVTFNLKSDDYYCPNGKTGLYCQIDCKINLNLNQDCLRGVICEESGCTCRPGLSGTGCDAYCTKGTYGYGCAESCDNCIYQNCNYITGECLSGCDNSRTYHVPPFCRAEIVLPSPKIDLISETSAQVSLIAKDEYKMVTSSYAFIIEPQKPNQQDRFTMIYANTTELVKRFDDLEPGSTYSVRATLTVEAGRIPIHSPEITFSTLCNPSTTFEVTPYETRLVLNNILQSQTAYPCPAKWYKVLIEEIPLGVTTSPKEVTEFPREFTDLKPFTKYKVKVYRSNVTFFDKEVATHEGAPSPVRSVRNTSLSPTHVTLQWEEPAQPNGVISEYIVALEVHKYLGCEDLNRKVEGDSFTTLTRDTTITLSILHPYTQYIVSITAVTSSKKLGHTKDKYVTTYPNEIPTAVVSELHFQDDTLTWSDPEDCTKITGPIGATKIILTGISNNVKNFHDEQNTFSHTFRLSTANQVMYGAETYRARIYVMRKFSLKYNESVYAEEIFNTTPKAPPAVRELECYEINSDTKTSYLRWKEPLPPTNGQIEYYTVVFCNKPCKGNLPTFTVPVNQICNLWEDYICAKVKQPNRAYTQIVIWANNKNVSDAGQVTFLRNDRLEFAPSAPLDFKSEVLSGSVIELTWIHPWKTGGPLTAFVINIELTSTKLREAKSSVRKTVVHKYTVTEYRQHYVDRLYLRPSSNYTFTIYGKTKLWAGVVSTAEAQTPSSLAFSNSLKWEMYASDSTIRLEIPHVLNDTENSAMYVIVVGPRPCEQYSKVDKVLSQQAQVQYYETGWIAAVLTTSEYSGETFIVGDNRIYNGATNCLLYARESYVVIVVVQSENGSIVDQVLVERTTSIHIGDVPPTPVVAWLIPLVIIIVVAAAALFLWRSRINVLHSVNNIFKINIMRRRSPKETVFIVDEMSLSQHGNCEDESIPGSPYEIRKPIETTKRKKQDSLSRGSTPDILQSPIIADEKENMSALVKVKDFQDYVKDAIQTGLLDRQYEVFPRGPTRPCEYGKIPQNKSKNRYANLIAYDETRVVLEKLPDNPYSDYINANYIKGYKKDKCYIATQGPKSSTVIDFWRMIWQEEVLVICMLANVIENGKTKCEQYWPDIGKKRKYGNIVVFNAKHSVFADYTFRIWHVTYGQETRKIEHLHYTAWPDHGVPLYTHSVVTYLKKLLATPAGNGPVVVHCSAGVGRTGTIILCDICLRRAAAEGVVDVLAETKVIRSQRANMVDNKQQYLLAHLALVECLLSLPTALPCNENLPSKIKDLKKQLVIQLQRLQDTAWQDEALRPSNASQQLSERNIAKNRYPELVTEKASRVYLKRHPPNDEDSDYISAVYVDGVKYQNQYLASQLPMPNTLSDFWRMVAEFKIELIIMLQPPDPEDTTCCSIAPKCGEFKPTSYINVTTEEATTMEYYTHQKAVLIDNSEKPPRKQPVTILCSTEWKPGRKRDPPSTVALITLWQAAEKISRGDGPTVTLCHDGVSACGLFLALSFLLERMGVERECDVCLAVRAVRRSRPDFIQSLEQLEYLYDAAVTYLQYFETYANFS